MSSKQAVNLDYLHYLRQALLNPLQKYGAEGASQAVQLLDDYQLIKEDVDNIMEISIWGGQPDSYSKLDSKVSRMVWMVNWTGNNCSLISNPMLHKSGEN